MPPGSRVIALAARLVPSEHREAWRQEWEAEVAHALRQREPSRWWLLRLRIRIGWCVIDALGMRWVQWRKGGQGPWRLAEGGVDDLRLALRTLSRERAFSALTVLTLAVAIGADTALYSAVDGVLIRPLPYRDADRIVRVSLGRRPAPGRTGELPFSDRGYWYFVNGNRTFSAFGGYSSEPVQSPLTGDGPAIQVDFARMTVDAFEVLGVQPQLGRLPSRDEEQQVDFVALLSHGLWVDRYGTDPSVIGTTIDLRAGRFQVIGVMPEGFDFPTPTVDVWIPYYLNPESANFGMHHIDAIARLAPGASIADAQADATRLIGRFSEVGYGPDFFASVLTGSGVVRSLRDDIVGAARGPLWILLGAMSLVVIMACGNVAHLLLVRADARAGQTAVRAALGSGRWRLARYAFVESMMLALLGGLGGLLLAYIGTVLFRSLGPSSVPRLNEVRIRGSALLFTSTISLGAGVLFGTMPALRAGAAKALPALKQGVSQVAGPGRRGQRTQSAFIIAQVALASVVVMASGLMARSMQQLLEVDLGFQDEGVLTFRVSPSLVKYRSVEIQARLYDELIRRLEELPSVEAAGAVTVLPLAGVSPTVIASIEGFEPPAGELGPSVVVRRATQGYFEAMRIPVVEGRAFVSDDSRLRLGSVIVSESIKEVYWPGESGLGKRIVGGGDPATSVGVVGDVHALGVDSPAEPHLYRPLLDSGNRGQLGPMTIVVRTDGEPTGLVSSVRGVMEGLDPDLPLSDIRPMSDLVADSMSRRSFTMSLMLLAATIALVLGSIGVYGTITYVVKRRSGEIGIRMALGADGRTVALATVGRAIVLTGAGVLLGLSAVPTMAKALSPLLYEVRPFDTAVLLVAAGIFLLTTVLASSLPAARAARVHPAVALRHS